MEELGTEVEEKIFKCSGCGGVLHYEPGKPAMKCPYCGSEEEIAPPTEKIVEHDLSELDPVPSTSQLGFGTKSSRYFRCDMCGATAAIDGALTATKCAYCDSSVVVDTTPVEGMVRPESLVPFQIEKDGALELYRQWISTLWFRPNDLKKKAMVADIHGMYAPHFTYDANAYSTWSGYAGYYYTVRVGKTTIRKVRWVHRSGVHSAFYDDELICASSGLRGKIIEKIYPYNLGGLVPYKPEFLSGFMAEAYTVDPKTGWAEAVDKMRNKERSACRQLLGGETQRGLRVSTALSNPKWKHLLLPLFIASYAYKSDVYRFMVNGQTGEVQGEAPWSWLKIGAVIGAVAGTVIGLFAYGKYAGWF